MIERGTYTLTRVEGLSFAVGTGKMDTKMEFSGNLEDINRAIGESVFKPSLNWNSLQSGTGKLNFIISDALNVSHSNYVVVHVEPVNDAPVIMLPGQHLHAVNTVDDDLSNVLISVDTIISAEDTLVPIPDVSVRDIDAGENLLNSGFVTMTVEAIHGTVWLTKDVVGIHRYLVGDGINDTVVSFISTVEIANQALAGLSYQGFPNFFGECGVWLTINDTANAGINVNNVDARDNGEYKNIANPAKQDRQYVPILLAPINDEPVINLPLPETLVVLEDNELVLLDLSIFDIDNNETEEALITLSAEHGSITLTRLVT
jgi:hypothetical protein